MKSFWISLFKGNVTGDYTDFQESWYYFKCGLSICFTFAKWKPKKPVSMIMNSSVKERTK
jgi:hypothetical protein